MTKFGSGFGCLLFLLVACGAPAEPPAPPAVPSPTLTERPVRAAPPVLPDAVKETRDEILALTARDSLRAFSRYAENTESFISNFEGSEHFNHWSLMRRTGVDPMRQIEGLFEDRHGVRQVGEELWYIWPDFAAVDPSDLKLERLDFRDRARLIDIIGEEGVEAVQSGAPYPGIRTAISETGRWVYYLHEIGHSEDTP